MTINHKEIDKKYFKMLYQQAELRKEMVGQRIIAAFYTSKIEGYNIDIKDSTIIHIPTGSIILQLSNHNYYQIYTNYQTWSGGEYGLMLKKLDINKFEKLKTDKNYFEENTNWQLLNKQKIISIQWNWKTAPNCTLDKQGLTARQAKELIYIGCWPDNFIFHFSNEQKIYFFALEPDSEIEPKKTYTLISGGEEIMIFFDETKLKHWEITTIGFEIINK